MKKLLLILIFIQSSAVLLLAQVPEIKVEQYKIIVNRDFYRTSHFISAFRNYAGNSCPQQNNTGIEQYGDGTGSTTTPKSRLRLYINNQPFPYHEIINTISPAITAPNEHRYFSDTINIYQPNYAISKISSDALIRRFLFSASEYGNASSTYQCFPSNFPLWSSIGGQTSVGNLVVPRDTVNPAEVSLPGNFIDTTILGVNDDIYNVSTRIQVLPNLDISYSLPSHDRILIKGVINGNPSNQFNANWEYAVYDSSTPSQVFLPVPTTLYPNNSPTLNVSGVDLFGVTGYADQLHKTIFFRVINMQGGVNDTSAISVFFHRLSSPHITSVTPTNVTCFNENNGSLKINFDRSLLPSEKLSILALDTVHQLNYSAFNLTSLGSDSSYAWPNQLGPGKYYISLIGRYANNLPYDIDVFTRDTSVHEYEALNSISFHDGFNTPDDDNFKAYPDFGGNAQVTYTGAITHTAIPFPEITQPGKIIFAARVDSNVICKGSAAGVVTLGTAGGYLFPGNNRYYKYSLKKDTDSTFRSFVHFTNTTPGPIDLSPVPFTSSSGITQKIRDLTAGIYQVRVRDSVDCITRDSTGNEATYSFTITEPAVGLTIDSVHIYPITSYDSTNGGFKLHITGGYPFAPGETNRLPYDVFITDTVTNLPVTFTGTRLSPTTDERVERYNLGAGVYRIIVRDKFYNVINPPYNVGCYLELIIPLRRPDSLTLDINKRKGISCLGQNDGELLAVARGGVRNDSTNYHYQWYKIVNNISLALPAADTSVRITDSLINRLSPGRYRVVITDRYNNVKADTFDLSNPTSIQVSLSSIASKCFSSRTGSMRVDSVWGGTPFTQPGHAPYRFEWSNGALTSQVDSVSGGRYILVVTDSVSCYAIDSITVAYPPRLQTSYTTVPVTCYNSTNGEIHVTTLGGIPPYKYTWSTGDTTNSSLTNLAPGSYWYNVTDNNMVCYESDTITLIRPDTILVNLGPDRLLCLGQTLRLDATVPNATQPLTYSWQGPNGFASALPKANIVNPGSYNIAVSNTTGCTLRDTIQVTRLDSLVNTDFIVSSQAFKNENVILVSLSQPYPHDSVKWVIPTLGNTITVISQSDRSCILKFADTGRYNIGLRVYYKSGCIDDTVKSINVINSTTFGNLGSQANAFKIFGLITPNPNNGSFELHLTFSQYTQAKVRMIDMLSNNIVRMDNAVVSQISPYTATIVYNVGVAAGTYALVIDTPKGSFAYKVIIQ
jgi:hypothetical protein